MGATKTKRRYGPLLPIGNLEGEVITRKMLRKKVKASPKVLEFLQFCELLNRGGV